MAQVSASRRHGKDDLLCPRTKKSLGRPLGDTALAIRDGVHELTQQYDRMTVRQVFYRLETAGVVEKSQAGYRQVQQQLLRMRRENALSWQFITDGTRWQRKPESFGDAESYIDRVVHLYRRDLWQGQNVRLEIWLEKDALADVIFDATEKWDVPLMVSRGQSSATFLYSAAKAAEHAHQTTGVETFIFTMYDYDAGGERAARTIRRELPEYAPNVPISFERLAVTTEQIEQWRLPQRPAKKSDPEAAKFGEVAVELDAIDPNMLVSLVEGAIERHIDAHAWVVEQAIETEERAGLRALAAA